MPFGLETKGPKQETTQPTQGANKQNRFGNFYQA